MLFNNMAYLPVKSGRQPNIERLQIGRLQIFVYIHDVNNFLLYMTAVSQIFTAFAK